MYYVRHVTVKFAHMNGHWKAYFWLDSQVKFSCFKKFPVELWLNIEPEYSTSETVKYSAVIGVISSWILIHFRMVYNFVQWTQMDTYMMKIIRMDMHTKAMHIRIQILTWDISHRYRGWHNI